ATLVFDHPTPTALASYLLDRVSPTEETAAAQDLAKRPQPRGINADEPIAIVGMSCRLPGGVTSSQELWRLLSEEQNAISEFPTNRGWDLGNLYDPDPDVPGRSYTNMGGFLHEADQFDPGFFGISPREALATEPQQRVLLETAWTALEHARIAPDSLRGTQAGVFIGAIAQEYGPG
ncbi:beta-ketoacyl synthase N-terminal-like domain-containing protein, partial [Streptomyces sp. MCAF7]